MEHHPFLSDDETQTKKDEFALPDTDYVNMISQNAGQGLEYHNYLTCTPIFLGKLCQRLFLNP